MSLRILAAATLAIFSMQAAVFAAPSDVLRAMNRAEPPTRAVDAPNAHRNETPAPRRSPTARPVEPNDAFSRADNVEMQRANYRYTEAHNFPELATQRGWSDESIDLVINRPYTIRSAIDGPNNGRPSTAYFRRDGHYIVLNNESRHIVQLSDTTRPIGRLDQRQQWATESNFITDPYIPPGAPGY